MNNYISAGETLELTAPSGGVVSGTGYKIGGFVGIACATADAGVTVNFTIVGLFNVTKEGAGSGQAWTEGASIYYDATNKRFTTTSTSNTLCGYAAAAATTTATTGYLRLIPGIA